MNTIGWVLTRTDETPDGTRPLVLSISASWIAGSLPLPGSEWMLCHVRCSAEHVVFMKQDPDFVWIGNEFKPEVPQQVLDAYASKLDPNVTYHNLEQVLDKLSEWEPRFLLRVK